MSGAFMVLLGILIVSAVLVVGFMMPSIAPET